MNMRFTVTVLLIGLTSSFGYGQIGKFLKDKAKSIATEENFDKLRGATSDKLADARAELDSTNFNFAISVNDNADVIDTESGKDKALKLITNLDSREDTSEADKARSLLDAGELAYAKRYYKRAETLLTMAQENYEASYIEDANYYKTISNLGLLFSTMGRYVKAEEYTIQALEKRKEKLGEESLGYGSSLNNLGVLQTEMGKYNEAEKNSHEAVLVLSKAAGEKSMPVAIALNNEAMFNEAVGRYDQALEILNKAIDISGELQSEKSGNHQKFLTNRAMLYQAMGRHDDAESEFNALIKLKERRFGKNHPDYAHMLNNLASLYMAMEKYDKVEDLLKQARDIYENKFTKEHRLYAASISDLGNFYRFSTRYDEAKPLLEEAKNINETVLGTDHPDFVQSKEDLAILYWKMKDIDMAKELYKSTLEQTLTFINNYFPPMSESEKTKYWEKLRPRFERFYSFAFNTDTVDAKLIGEAYDYHIATKGLLLSSANKIKQKILSSNDKELVDEYRLWLDQKESLAKYYGYSKEELDDQKINRDSLEVATNETEKNLSQKSALFSESYKLKQISYKDITAKLKGSQAVVELIRYRTYDQSFSDEVNYAALVLTLESKSPQLSLIKNGTQLEGRYFKYYNNAIHQKINDEYSYDQYWSTIAPLLESKKDIFLSSDGIYNQINVNTLIKNGRYVIDDYEIHIVGNSKYIGRKSITTTIKTAYLVGNPTFGGNIDALPGTKNELASISKTMTANGYKVTQFTTTQATEENLKKVDNPAILHIATHGYFLQDVEATSNKVFGVSAESAKNNPLLRSGLLLANAGNVIDNNTASLNNSDNGILTAYEAINLKLDKTKLVVLSACETAVGDVKAGEGVYGLQRAFMGAGTQSLLMSLWKVSDEATQELMTKFYTNWLKTGDRQKAFRQAEIALKTKYPQPYYWGAFVMLDN
jgi:CHAT domain-containing protein